jgi:hypothetical protein
MQHLASYQVLHFGILRICSVVYELETISNKFKQIEFFINTRNVFIKVIGNLAS